MARTTWQHASADPMASPSGRACDVSTNRSRCSICWRTSFNIAMLSLHPFSYGTSSSFSLGPAVLPLAPFPARNGPAGKTIPERAAAANAPSVRALYILWLQSSLLGCDPPPGRLHPHPPEPAPIGRHRPHAPQSPLPVRCGDRPALLPRAFRSPRAKPRPTAHDGTLPRASPRSPRSKTHENIRKPARDVGPEVLLSRTKE